ncbi:MAG: bifunctional biotin--[acetyl-CoA-carboxylase] ligase/biotin operon repressor BirA, partial [Motiliproteus sp.]|nr:bifunctional biotin--[acetyl-CoA-carboxylase] ligase/biotin operon repressor BirA [Motiliproteus sp.]
MSLNGLLEVLADGQFHSGEDLGARLGVSRSAVWKQLKKLQALGIDHYSVKGRGYRIPGGLNLLSVEKLSAELDARVAAKLHAIDLQLSVDSTNVMAMQGIQKGQNHGFLYLAERQTAGKGRRGRDWISPFSRNLYFSLTWSFTQGAAALEGLSLVVGLALARGLSSCGVEGVGLKWPNDLLSGDKKLAGILLEMTGDASGVCQVVIGVGVNVAMSESEGGAIDQPWTDVSSCLSDGSGAVDRNRLLAAILNELVPALERFSEQGFAPFKESWMGLDGFANRRVRLQTSSQQFQGVAKGVDSSGALLLETE